MEDAFSVVSSVPSSPCPEMCHTITPSVTSLDSIEEKEKLEDAQSEEKKPVKKRKSWGQELPTPKTNLPPRYVIHGYFFCCIGRF